MQKDVKLGITKEKLIDATFALMEEAEAVPEFSGR